MPGSLIILDIPPGSLAPGSAGTRIKVRSNPPIAGCTSLRCIKRQDAKKAIGTIDRTRSFLFTPVPGPNTDASFLTTLAERLQDEDAYYETGHVWIFPVDGRLRAFSTPPKEPSLRPKRKQSSHPTRGQSSRSKRGQRPQASRTRGSLRGVSYQARSNIAQDSRSSQ